jgi:hypothetical protein
MHGFCASVAGCAANEDLDLDGRTLLRALWEEPGRYSRNRHYAALQTPNGQAARREVRLCRSILGDLSRHPLHGASVAGQANAGGGGFRLKLCLSLEHLRREVVLSPEALDLLVSHRGAQCLREALQR